MPQYNIPISNIEQDYLKGQLPQRNNSKKFYFDTSSRANLSTFNLSSENRRILNKTENFSFEIKPISYNIDIQKQINKWLKILKWDFPISSVKKIFSDHIFNYMYIWYDENKNIIAYSVCYFSDSISHIAYVFYDPKFDHSNLPIRLVLQTIIDSQEKNLKYCYLGRFSQDTGYYKRTMPGFEYFDAGAWITL